MTEHPTELMGRQSAYQEGYEAGERAQLQRDAEADCAMCADPARYEAATWMERDGGYYHRTQDDTLHWCDATMIWGAWAERAAQEGNAKT